MAEKRRVGPLKRISLHLEAGRSADCMDITAEPLAFDFIYGIASGGLSPFEIELAAKCEGEELLIAMSEEQMPSFFQHLLPLPLNLPDQGIFTLKARIEGVSEPDPREIIKAMAEAAECGSHCCGQ